MKIIKTSWTYMRRSPYQALAAIITMFLTLLLSGAFLLMSVSSAYILRYFESKPQITVFFNDKSAPDQAKSLTDSLNSTGKVESIKYISKDDALSIYKEQNKNDPLLLEMVSADILPASLEVTATDPKYLQEFVPFIQKAEGVEEVVYQKDVVDALISWTSAIRLIGAVLAGLFSVDALLIIMTVIGMKIAIKKEEVEILTLVGASPWYIRMPFIFEGGLYGVIGAVFSWSALVGFVFWMRPILITFLGSIPTFRLLLINPFGTLSLLLVGAFLGILALIGFMLGSMGSLIAVGRYLKL